MGTRWSLDPKPTVGISDYAVNANNPIYYTDPLGDFRTKFGANVYKFFHGGTVHEDTYGQHKGEFFVEKNEVTIGKKGRGRIGENQYELNEAVIHNKTHYDWGIEKTLKKIDNAMAGHSDGANTGSSDLGFHKWEYQGKTIFTVPFVEKDAAFTPANFVIVGSNVFPDDKDMLSHELGHTEDYIYFSDKYSLAGPLIYTFYISIPSAVNYLSHGKIGGEHSKLYTEKRANRNAVKNRGPFELPSLYPTK